MVVDGSFCVWVAGQPASVVDSIARAVALELAHHRQVSETGSDWPTWADPERRRRALAHLSRALAVQGVAVVMATGRVGDRWRREVRAVVPRLVEVHVGRVPAGERAPDVIVTGDGARAGESAMVVLRHLAAAGLSEPLDDYSEDDEAAVSGRLQAFGYL